MSSSPSLNSSFCDPITTTRMLTGIYQPVISVSVSFVVAGHDVEHDGQAQVRIGPEEVGGAREAAPDRREHSSEIYKHVNGIR